MKLRIWQYIQMNNRYTTTVINTLINIIGIEHFCMHVSYYYNKYISKLKLEVGIDVYNYGGIKYI